MLVYHIMSGMLHFDDLNNQSEIKTATLEGVKPSFNIGTHKQTPTMPALREVMERCWNDLPQDRPEGGSILNAMLDEGFLCLQKVIPMDQAVVHSLYSATDKATVRSSVSFRITIGKMYVLMDLGIRY